MGLTAAECEDSEGEELGLRDVLQETSESSDPGATEYPERIRKDVRCRSDATVTALILGELCKGVEEGSDSDMEDAECSGDELPGEVKKILQQVETPLLKSQRCSSSQAVEAAARDRFSKMGKAKKLQHALKALAECLFRAPKTYRRAAVYLSGKLRHELLAGARRPADEKGKLACRVVYSSQEEVQTMLAATIFSTPWASTLTRKKLPMVRWFRGAHETKAGEHPLEKRGV